LQEYGLRSTSRGLPRPALAQKSSSALRIAWLLPCPRSAPRPASVQRVWSAPHPASVCLRRPARCGVGCPSL